jgi:putative ABC transport system permease protein
MIGSRYIPLIFKQVWRHRTRSLLTVGGVAVAMFLFVSVQALQRSVREATAVTAADTTLVVYRENRFCPATSRLPEWYADRIRRVDGVSDVLPVKVVVNTCLASLDVVTFRGVPMEQIDQVATRWRFLDGGVESWRQRSDAAILGERLANRRGLKVGDAFEAAGVRVTVAGIVHSDEAQDQNVAYVQLEFLQQAALMGGVGIVTQFNVRVSDPTRLAEIASAIDETFRADAEPTQTRAEKAFVAQAGADVVNIIGFTRYLGWGCLAAMLALIANAIVLGVQQRVREHAVLQTLGYRGGLIMRLILMEGLLVSAVGGALGAVGAALLIEFGTFTLTNEGLSIPIEIDAATIAIGLALASGVGVLAGLVPAWQAGRREIATCFRAV